MTNVMEQKAKLSGLGFLYELPVDTSNGQHTSPGETTLPHATFNQILKEGGKKSRITRETILRSRQMKGTRRQPPFSSGVPNLCASIIQRAKPMCQHHSADQNYVPASFSVPHCRTLLKQFGSHDNACNVRE
ncbi:hypothetical protein TNCV_495001 [Trichonephila clavipes]|nr:hypothetical protein TNCV_495001 [Trichonephila clavipes]